LAAQRAVAIIGIVNTSIGVLFTAATSRATIAARIRLLLDEILAVTLRLPPPLGYQRTDCQEQTITTSVCGSRLSMTKPSMSSLHNHRVSHAIHMLPIRMKTVGNGRKRTYEIENESG
jgi:hypothetical protein